MCDGIVRIRLIQIPAYFRLTFGGTNQPIGERHHAGQVSLPLNEGIRDFGHVNQLKLIAFFETVLTQSLQAVRYGDIRQIFTELKCVCANRLQTCWKNELLQILTPVKCVVVNRSNPF